MCRERSCLWPSLCLRLDRLQNLHEFRALVERHVRSLKFRQDIDQITEPKDRLFGFLERNADLVDEIRYGFGTVSLVIVSADGSRGLADLEAEILELPTVDILDQPLDICREFDRPRFKFGAELLSA